MAILNANSFISLLHLAYVLYARVQMVEAADRTPKSIRLFGNDIAVNDDDTEGSSKGSNDPPLTSNPRQRCQRKIYSKEDLQRLGWKYNESQQVPHAQLMEMSPVQRARHLPPNELRSIRVPGIYCHRSKFPHGQTNAEFVDEQVAKRREYSARDRVRYRERMIKSGGVVMTRSRKSYLDRKERAKEAGETGVIKMRTGKQALRDDAKGRSGVAYMREDNMKRKDYVRASRKRKREREQKAKDDRADDVD